MNKINNLIAEHLKENLKVMLTSRKNYAHVVIEYKGIVTHNFGVGGFHDENELVESISSMCDHDGIICETCTTCLGC